MICSAYNGALYRALNGLCCSMTEPAVSWWAWPCQRRAGTVIGAERCQQIQERARCVRCPYYQQGAAYVRPVWEAPPYFAEWYDGTAEAWEVEWGEVRRVEGILLPTARCRRLKHTLGKDGRCLVCEARQRSGKTITAQYCER